MKEKEFRQYIFPFTWQVYAGGILLLSISILPMLALGVGAVVFFLILIGLYLYFVLKRYREYRSFLDDLSGQGKLTPVCEEFSSAHVWLNDGIRTGANHIFCKKQPVLYLYSDILNLYEYEHKTNFVTDQRCLCAVIKGGKRVILCNLKKTLKQNPEAIELLKTLMMKNPSITLGYQNSKAVARQN